MNGEEASPSRLKPIRIAMNNKTLLYIHYSWNTFNQGDT
jgi:hypothetical protein